MEKIRKKLIILGSGPAGLTAAIYSARALLEPLLLKGSQPGGQLTLTEDVENFPGFSPAITGTNLIQAMENQALYCGANIESDQIEKVELGKMPFQAYGVSGNVYEADAMILATGASAKWLNLSNEKKFLGAGVSACATCDGFFFKNQPVFVIGGGNTAAEEALYLSNLCSQVTIVHRRAELRAEPLLIKRLKEKKNVHFLLDHVLEDLSGTDKPLRLEKIKLRNLKTEEEKWHDCAGCFVAIGHKPNTQFLNNQIAMDSEGYILLKEAGRSFTSVPGIFAAGDVADKHYRQAITAAATGCMAALDAFHFLQQRD